MPVLILIFPLLFLSCSHSSKTEKTAQAYFEKAQKYKKSRNHPKALENLQKLRKEFFSSSYNEKALLMTADIYFDQKKYPLAQSSYEKYQKLYPKKNKEYVLYHLALSYKNQLPSRSDHDLSSAELALSTLEELLALNSSYHKSALKVKKEVLDKKTEKELKTILFFKSQGWLKPAFKRVKKLLKTYPDSSFTPKALLTASQLAEKLGEDPKPFKKQLLNKYPKSASAKQLKSPTLFYILKERLL